MDITITLSNKDMDNVVVLHDNALVITAKIEGF